jgi:hypothetical protein
MAVVFQFGGGQGPAGVGVPAGGTTGQVLAKASGTDYDTEWVDQGGGVPGSGTVTSVSVATANGFAGTVATTTTTPAITLKTTVTGLLKGNGTGVSAAVAGTDYLAPTGSGAGLTGVALLAGATFAGGVSAPSLTAANGNGNGFAVGPGDAVSYWFVTNTAGGGTVAWATTASGTLQMRSSGAGSSPQATCQWEVAGAAEHGFRIDAPAAYTGDGYALYVNGVKVWSVSGSGAVAAAGAVTGSNLSGTNTGDQFTGTTAGVLLGRRSTGAGPAEEITLGAGLSLTGTTLTASGGGGGAPATASYLTLGTDGTLTSERVLTAGTGITLTDAGAGSTLTVAVTANTYQPLDAELTALAGLTSAANKVPYFTGSGTAGVTDFTAVARQLVANVSAAGMLTTLGIDGASDVTFASVTATLIGDGSLISNMDPSALATAVPTSKGGLGANNSAATGIPVFAAGTATVTAATGTGAPVRATSPTLVTPALGTPSSGTLTNCTGLPVGGISATGTPSGSTYLRGDGAWATPAGGGGGTVQPSQIDHRLTTESGVSVSTSDRTGQSTLYLTPYKGTHVSLYDGSAWQDRTTAEISLALSGLTSGKNYDVFAYYTGSAVALELSAAWASDTARTDALTTQDGVAVKSGALTRRWVGTIRTTGTTTTEDSQAKRFVWNAANQASRTLYAYNNTSHSYGTAAFREWNGATNTHCVEWATGEVGVVASSGWIEFNAPGGATAIATLSLNNAAAEGDGAALSQSSGFVRANPGFVGAARAGFNRLTVTEYATSSCTFNAYKISGGVWA